MTVKVSPLAGMREFADNPEQRCPCILLLDRSLSMLGEPIRQLNEGLLQFKKEMMADKVVATRVDIAVITFGPVELVSAFQSADSFHPPHLTAAEDTPMGEAISAGLDLLEERKREYRDNGIPYFRPWVFLMTDGKPSDHWLHLVPRIAHGETSGAFSFYAVGLQGADMKTLERLSKHPPYRLHGLRFADMFMWLSSSLSSAARSQFRSGDILKAPSWAVP